MNKHLPDILTGFLSLESNTGGGPLKSVLTGGTNPPLEIRIAFARSLNVLWCSEYKRQVDSEKLKNKDTFH